MPNVPEYGNLSVSDMQNFVRIVDMIRDPKAPARTYKDVERRLKEEAKSGKSTKIANVSDCLAKISRKIYEKPGLLIYAAAGDGIVRVLEEGHRLYNFASIVLKAMKRAQTDTAQQSDVTLTISSATAFAAHILPWLLSEYFRHSYFRYVWLYEHTQVTDILRNVGSGLADIGICIDWPDHNLNKTEIIRATRGILASERYLNDNDICSRDSLADKTVITYQPNSLRRIKLDDIFPEPSKSGVRVYAESENAVYGWIGNDAAVGHGYMSGVKPPSGTRFILGDLLQEKPDACWCAYTVHHLSEDLEDLRQREVLKVVQAMKKAAQRFQRRSDSESRSISSPDHSCEITRPR